MFSANKKNAEVLNVTVLFSGSTIPPSALKVTWYSPASYLATNLVISVPITYVVLVINLSSKYHPIKLYPFFVGVGNVPYSFPIDKYFETTV